MNLSDFQRKAVKARWAKTTPEERSAHARKMVAAREAKRKPTLFACKPCIPGRTTKAGWTFCTKCGGNVTQNKS